MSGDDVKPTVAKGPAGDSGTAAGADVKPSAEGINLKVRDGDGNVVQFRIRRNTPMQKLMKAFCTKVCARPPWRQAMRPSVPRFL
jgi:hypothetical protein